MTDDTDIPGRIDLRSLEASDPSRADRVIAAAMAEIASAPRSYPRNDVAATIGGMLRPALAAAAVLIAVTLSAMATRRVTSDDPSPLTALADWTVAGKTPTNGELLAAFQGYGR